MIFNVVTTMGRPENFSNLLEMLKPMNVKWHVITDNDAGFTLSFSESWIKHYSYDNNQQQFFERSNHAMNCFIEQEALNEDEMYCFLNDDDAYEPDFFEKISKAIEYAKSQNHHGEIVVCSMKRGDNIPPDVKPPRCHPTTTLHAHPDNIRPGEVGLEQIILSGKVLKHYRFPLLVDGDGRFVVEVVRNNGAMFCPDAYVWFNYYEPGRWNT